MVRPGRLDKLLYVDLPTPSERVEILRAQTKRTPLGPDVNLDAVARDTGCDGFSGADLGALVREAAVSALREVFDSVEGMGEGDEDEEAGEVEAVRPVVVEQRHFLEAVRKTSPSVSVAQRKRFATLRAKFAGLPVGHAKDKLRETEADGPGGVEETTT